MGDRVGRRDGARWGLRTIRPGGRVRWCGRWFKLEDGPTPVGEYEAIPDRDRSRSPLPRYDGRLDGRRGLFYDYGAYPSLADRVFLHSIGDEWPGPQCVAGVFVWDRFIAEAKRG